MGRALERISGYGHIAVRYGLEEAIFLDNLMYWYKENRANERNFRDGRWWTYNSVSALAQLFPWWSIKQLRRITESCREQGAVLAGNYSEDQRDRTLWYTPGDELLKLYGMAEETTMEEGGQFPEPGSCIGPNGQTDLPEQASVLAQTGKCYKDTCYNHVCTNMNTPLPPTAEMPKKAETPKREKAPRQPQAARAVVGRQSNDASQGHQDEIAAVLDAYAGEDRELRERLEEFREVRKRKKKPLQTRRAAAVLTGRLDKLSAGDRAVKLALLDTAILHGWDSVYPLKEGEAPGVEGQKKPLRGKGVTYI